MPHLYTPSVLIVIAAAPMIVGAAIGPETREVELHLPDLGREPTDQPARLATPRSA